MTRLQTDVLDFIASWSQLKGRPPSIGDIGKALGLWPNHVHEIAQWLEANGYVTTIPTLARTIVATEKGRPENREATMSIRLRA